ncbi:MAG: tetratricopeptide repeat protein [Nitrospirota bacterium]
MLIILIMSLLLYEGGVTYAQDISTPFYAHQIDGKGTNLFKKGVDFFNKGYYKRAIPIFEKIVRRYPDSSIAEPSAFFIGDIYLNMAIKKKVDKTMLKKALKAYRWARRRYPKTENAIRGLFKIGETYAKLRLYYEAQGNFKRIISEHPDSIYAPKASLEIGKIYILLERFKDAITEFQKIIIQYSKKELWDNLREILPEVYFRQADSLYYQKRYKDAYKLYKNALIKWPDYTDSHPETLLNIGETFIQRRYLKEAREPFSTFLDISSMDISQGLALFKIAETYRIDKDYNKASEIYSKIVSSYTGSDSGLLSRLRLDDIALTQKQGSFEEKVLSIEDILSLEKYLKHSITTYKNDIEKYPLYFLLQYTLITTAREMKEKKMYDKSILLYRRLVSQYPKGLWQKEAKKGSKESLKSVNEIIDSRLINHNYNKHNYIEVIKIFQENKDEVFRDKNRNIKALFQVAESYNRTGLFLEAIPLYKIVLEEMKDNSDLKKKALYRLGEMYLKNGDYTNAILLLERVRKSYPEDSGVSMVIERLGDAYYQNGDHKKALTIYNLWLNRYKGDKGYKRVLYRVGNIHKKRGSLNKSIAIYKRLIRLINKSNEEGSEPILSNIYFQLGDAYYQQNRCRDAVSSFQEAVNADLNEAEIDWANYYMGNCYLKIKRHEEGKKLFTQLSAQSHSEFLKMISSERLRDIQFEEKYIKR